MEVTTKSGTRMGTIRVVRRDVGKYLPWAFLRNLTRNMCSSVFIHDKDGMPPFVFIFFSNIYRRADALIGVGTIWRRAFGKTIRVEDTKYGIVSTMSRSLATMFGYWRCHTSGPIVLDPAFLVYLVTHENRSPSTYLFFFFTFIFEYSNPSISNFNKIFTRREQIQFSLTRPNFIPQQ
jgi:hypothetical protein